MEELIINVGDNKKVEAEKKDMVTKFDINYITEVKIIYGDEVMEKDEKTFVCVKTVDTRELIKIHNKYLIIKENYDKWSVKLTDRKTDDVKEYLVLLPNEIIPKFQSLNDTTPKSLGIWYKKLNKGTWKKLKISS